MRVFVLCEFVCVLWLFVYIRVYVYFVWVHSVIHSCGILSDFINVCVVYMCIVLSVHDVCVRVCVLLCCLCTSVC